MSLIRFMKPPLFAGATWYAFYINDIRTTEQLQRWYTKHVQPRLVIVSNVVGQYGGGSTSNTSREDTKTD